MAVASRFVELWWQGFLARCAGFEELDVLVHEVERILASTSPLLLLWEFGGLLLSSGFNLPLCQH